MDNFWFNADDDMNRGALYNFFESMRGPGKTYWSKCYCVKRFLKNKEQFIYLRRYKKEASKQKNFWLQILPEFPNVKLTQKGNELFINGELAGYICILSTFITEKSVNYDKVYTIIFDEFQLPKGNYRYLPNEVDTFFEFYSTVNRLRVDRPECRVIFLSNNMGINPYYDYFNIDLYNGTFSKKKLLFGRRWYNESFVHYMENSKFGELVKNTTYGEYAIHGSPMSRDMEQVSKKSAASILWFNIYVCKKTYGVWGDKKEAKLWISSKFDATYPTLCLSRPDMKNGMTLALPKDVRLKSLGDNYKLGLVWYESDSIREITAPAIARIVR